MIDEATARRANILAALWGSTIDLYHRFDIEPEISGSRRLVAEENMEVIEASSILEHELGMDSDIDTWDLAGKLAEEIADNIVVLMGLAMAHDVPLFLIYDKIEKVIEKNDAKNHETHTVADGKIRRVRM